MLEFNTISGNRFRYWIMTISEIKNKSCFRWRKYQRHLFLNNNCIALNAETIPTLRYCCITDNQEDYWVTKASTLLLFLWMFIIWHCAPLNIFGLGGIRVPILFGNNLPESDWPFSKDSWSLDAQNPPKMFDFWKFCLSKRSLTHFIRAPLMKFWYFRLSPSHTILGSCF